MALLIRNSAARSMHSVYNFTQGEDFNLASEEMLKVRLDYLHTVFERFCQNNQIVMARAEENEENVELEEHREYFDKMEELFLQTKALLGEKIESILSAQTEEQMYTVHENQDEQELADEQEQGHGADNNEQNTDNENDDVQSVSEQQNGQNVQNNPNFFDDSIESVRSIAPIQQLAQYQPIAPIYVQCNGGRSNGKIENSWGEFDGSLSKWRGFRDRFIAAVHDDQSYAPAMKFQALWNSLKGKALQDLGDWGSGNEEYSELWDRLKELYDRKYHTSAEILKKFMSLKKIEKSSEHALQKLSNVTNEVLRQLRAYNYPVESWDMIFVHELHAKLDFHTSRAWEMHRESETPTIKEMLVFLDKQAKALSGTQSVEQKKSIESQKRPWFNKNEPDNKRAKFSNQSSSSANTSSNSVTKAEFKPCKICNQMHSIYRCDKFRSLNLSNRRKSARENELCFNCLQSQHTSRECKMSACKRCDKKHNSLLCPENPTNQAVNVVQAKPKTMKKSLKKKPKKEE